MAALRAAITLLAFMLINYDIDLLYLGVL